MFWASASNSSNIDTILDQADVSLTAVLDQDEVLQECRGMNKKLIDFLLRPNVLHSMLDLITREPAPEIPMAKQYKFPSIVCEILTSDINFAQKIAGENQFLEKLFYFFRDSPPPLNPLLASYVCRVLSEIVARKLDQNWYSYQLNVIQMISYLQSEPEVVEWLLNHLGTSSVCDFLNKLVLTVEGPDIRNTLLAWLEKEQFVTRLMKKMSRGIDGEIHGNVSRLVGDLLFAFRDDVSAGPERPGDGDPFLLSLKEAETVKTLLTSIFDDEEIAASSVKHGLDLILAMIGITRRPLKQPMRRVDALDESNEDIYTTEEVKEAVLSRLDQMVRLLTAPPQQRPLSLTHGILESPVGPLRLAIAKFIAHMATLHDPAVNGALRSVKAMETLLDLVWANPWNTLLHRYVCKGIIQIVVSADAIGAYELVFEYNILERIMNVFENEEAKVGYLGHLELIVSAMESIASREGPFRDLMARLHDENGPLAGRWEFFLADKFDTYKALKKRKLGGVNVPVPGSHIPIPAIPFESDGVFWGASNLSALGASIANFNVDFDADTFSSSDDDKSKNMFELFCSERDGDQDDFLSDGVLGDGDSFHLDSLTLESPDEGKEDEGAGDFSPTAGFSPTPDLSPDENPESPKTPEEESPSEGPRTESPPGPSPLVPTQELN